MKDQDYFTFTSTYGTLCMHWGGGGGGGGDEGPGLLYFH